MASPRTADGSKPVRPAGASAISATSRTAPGRETASATYAASSAAGIDGLQRWSSSPSLGASSARAARNRGLEIGGQDRAGVERLCEAIDLVLHVGGNDGPIVRKQHVDTAVELVVERLHGVLVEDARAAPLAVRAAKLDVPMLRAGFLPVGGVDQRRATVRADVKRSVTGGLGDRCGARGLVGEVQDLDRLAAWQRHALDVGLLVVVGVIHSASPCRGYRHAMADP